MTHHRWLPAAGVALALASLLAMLQNLRSQSPFVDLRLMAPPIAPQGAPPSDASADSVCRFIALRGVLDDLKIRVNYLRTETTYLERDAGSLWRTWKGVFGIQGAFSKQNIGAADGAVEQRLQTRLFALSGRGSRISESEQGLTVKLRKVEERWLAASNDKDVSRSVDAISELRLKLSKLSDEVNAFDDAVRQGQSELDRLYPRIVDSIQRAAPNAVAMPEPWHWTYMASDKQRPALQYDFELRYDQEFERARRDIEPKRHVREQP